MIADVGVRVPQAHRLSSAITASRGALPTRGHASANGYLRIRNNFSNRSRRFLPSFVDDGRNSRLDRQRCRLAFFVDLHKAQQGVHPRSLLTVQGCADQSDHQVGPRSVQNHTLDLDHRADGHRPVAFQRQHAPQQKVRPAADGLNAL